MRIPRSNSRRRSAFTLIELLVVIAIIAILCALVAGAIFRLSASQYVKRTEATVKKIQTGFDAQWKAVIDDAHEDTRKNYSNISATQKANLLAAAGNDGDRAAVIWVKMRLKQEFPQTFAEIYNWNNAGNMVSYLPRKEFYFQEIQGATATNAPEESAVLLFLALTQTRRGVAFNVDDVGPGSVRVITVGNKQFKVFVDGWGTPVTFERWTNDPALLNELSNPPYVASNATYKDLQDPAGRLLSPTPAWPYSSVMPLLHPNTNQNRGPVIRSAGPDRSYATTNDDILGFRLMTEGQRGN